MKLKHSMKHIVASMGCAVAAASTQSVLAQDYYFIDHKPSDMRLQVCAGDNGKAVGAGERDRFTGSCVQFEKIMLDEDYFHIRSVDADKFLTPGGANNGAPLAINPTSWQGNWSQWSHVDTGDGYGRLVNKSNGKFIYAAGDRKTVTLQPDTWTGDYTRWKFTPVNGETPTPTPTPETPTPTPSPDTPTPTPTPICVPAAPETVLMEAESGEILGSASLFDDGAASGGQGVAFISTPGAGFSVSPTNQQASETVTLRYASELAGSISYSINGVNAGNASFSTTGAWVGSYSEITIDAAVAAGDSFEIFFENGDTALNADSVVFRTPGGGCDGSTPTPTPTPTPETPTPTPTPDNVTPPPVGDVVDVASTSELGSFLVAGDFHPQAGFTLYTFDNDNSGPSVCYNDCAVTWPPFLVDDASDVVSIEGATLGTAPRNDGTIQVTLNNEPLYFFVGDNNVGDTAGHTLGGVWWVADIESDVIVPPTPTPTPTPDGNTGGNGGGDFCLTNDGNGNGRVTHVDLPEPASGDQYLCLNGNCQRATLTGGVWQVGFTGLVEGNNYEIKTQLSACNGLIANVTFQAGGSCVASECLPPDVEAPTVPGAVAGTPKNGLAIDVSWNASTDDRGVDVYEIYVDGALDGTTASTSYAIDDLVENTSYSIEVAACDAAENCSAKSSAISVNTGAFTPDTTPPTVPSQLSGEATNLDAISISWAASFDVLGVVSEYIVYRDDAQIATVAGTAYDDSGLQTATAYSYQVVACDNSGNCSNKSAALVVETEKPDFSNIDFTFNSFVTGKGVGPAPRPDPIKALRTPVNGLPAREFGFAFDINGGSVSFRFGGSVPNAGGVEFSCSEDDGVTFKTVGVNGSASIPCSEPYTYFFRYLHPHSLNNDPAHQWIYTGYFTTEGGRIDPYAPGAYSFTDGSANWARIRHPITTDGITAAVLDRPNAGELLKNLDRYLIWVNDDSGNVDFEMDVSFMSTDDPRVPSDVVPGFRRNEALRSAAGGPNGQQFFMINTASPFGDDYRNAPQEALEGFGDTFSYGQVISFEFSVEAAGQSPAQTYNDFSHYVVGCGFCGKYGDPRLNSAGKAGTSQVFSDAGQYIELERNAIFTQPVTTLHSEEDIDDFIVGHHLFHGIKPGVNVGGEGRNVFDNPEAFIGKASCGGCHFRDGRGDQVVDTPRGPRVPPPVYGVALLEWIEGREAGFDWNGSAPTVADQVRSALVNDHGVNPDHLPSEVLELLTHYVNVLSVPDRNPGVYDIPGVPEGDVLFSEVGCADCHTPVQKTRADAPTHLRNLTIRPYTDMKTWQVNGGTYRTPPLWGLGQNLRLFGYNGKSAIYMHDGSASSIDEAIQLHDGEAAYSRERYNALSGGDKSNVVKFVETL